MLRIYAFLLIVLISFSSCSQGVLLYSKKKKVEPVINIPLSADKFVAQNADYFNENFEKLTGHKLKIERSDGFKTSEFYIVLRINPTLKNDFCIRKTEKNITIQGKDYNNLFYGVGDFFKLYTGLKYNASSDEILDEIRVEETFEYCASPDFSYREPYFTPNFDPNFRKWHNTDYLELEWGIWGHNLPKKIKKYNPDQSVYALINGQRNENQLCFSSERLFTYTDREVQYIFDNDFLLTKYMILPNDNGLSCTCDQCTAHGNTKEDASPAVFQFLNKLAKKHPRLEFFTAAYGTVKSVPKFPSRSNVGVFYSTIQIQKGIPIAYSPYFKDFQADIRKWKKYTSNVYIWDYAVNFDNYFDIYPSISMIQKNLDLYRKLGANGVFIHGSEYNYGVFQNLKSTLYAKLLWNTSININTEIERYFKENFSEELADLLLNQYSIWEQRFFTKKQELGIYSGMDQIIAKYLYPDEFIKFYNQFLPFFESHKNSKEFVALASSFTFLHLEIMRYYGLDKLGYANVVDHRVEVKKDVFELLDNLEKFSQLAGIKTYNEVQYTIEDYISGWRARMAKADQRKDYFYKKPFTVISDMDEDYTDKTVLNDGAFGLNYYNTNWHIASIDDVVLKIDNNAIGEAQQVTISFLQDLTHKIYYPSAIEIWNEKKEVIRALTIPATDDALNIKEISLDLPMRNNGINSNNFFYLKIGRSTNSGKNLLACDEIIFN